MNRKHKYRLGGKVRTFVFDLNTMCEFDQITGMNSLHDAIWEKPSFNTIRAMAFCALKRTDKEVTLDQVGEWVGVNKTGDLLRFLIEAYIDFQPEGKEKSEDDGKKKASV